MIDGYCIECGEPFDFGEFGLVYGCPRYCRCITTAENDYQCDNCANVIFPY